MKGTLHKYRVMAAVATMIALMCVVLDVHAAVTVPSTGTIVIKWSDYTRYHSNDVTQFITTTGNASSKTKPRTDVTGLTIVDVDNGGEILGVKYPGTALTSQARQGKSTWNYASGKIPQQEAINHWGQWFEYTLTVPQNCWIAVNGITAGTIAECGETYTTINYNDPRGEDIEGIDEGIVWSRRYGNAFVLSIDGTNRESRISAYPSIYKSENYQYEGDITDEFGTLNDAIYSNYEFMMQINDKFRWTSMLLDDGAQNDTLFTWPYESITGYSKWTPSIPKVSTDETIGDQWSHIFLSKGTHTLRLTKLAHAGGSWRGLLVPSTLPDPIELRLGDVNVDGIIDVADVVALANYLMGEIVSPEFRKDLADINGDKNINVADVVALSNLVIGGEMEE